MPLLCNPAMSTPQVMHCPCTFFQSIAKARMFMSQHTSSVECPSHHRGYLCCIRKPVSTHVCITRCMLQHDACQAKTMNMRAGAAAKTVTLKTLFDVGLYPGQSYDLHCCCWLLLVSCVWLACHDSLHAITAQQSLSLLMLLCYHHFAERMHWIDHTAIFRPILLCHLHRLHAERPSKFCLSSPVCNFWCLYRW